MNDNEAIIKGHYKNFSPFVLFMFPLIVGIFFISIPIISILTIILHNYFSEIHPFWLLGSSIFFIFGLKGLLEAKKEYKFQKEHNIKWK